MAIEKENEQWMVRVNLAGVHKPIRLFKRESGIHATGWWSKCGDYGYSVKPAMSRGCRDYVFEDRRLAKSFHEGARAVLTALNDFAGRVA